MKGIGRLQAGRPHGRHLRLPFLDVRHEAHAAAIRQPTSTSRKRVLSRGRPPQAQGVPRAHPARRRGAGAAPVPGRARTQRRLGRLRLLDANPPPGRATLGARRGARPAQHAAGISRGRGPGVNPREIHPRAHRPGPRGRRDARLVTPSATSALAETPRFRTIARSQPRRFQSPLPSLPVFPFS